MATPCYGVPIISHELDAPTSTGTYLVAVICTMCGRVRFFTDDVFAQTAITDANYSCHRLETHE